VLRGGVWEIKGEGAFLKELVWRPEVKRSLGRNRYRFKDENEVDLQDILWIIWNGLIWLGVVNFVYAVMPFCVPKLFGLDL
jgi:hypothetical protein